MPVNALAVAAVSLMSGASATVVPSLDADAGMEWLLGRSDSMWKRQTEPELPNSAPGLLASSSNVVSPAANSTFRFDGHLFDFIYDGIGGQDYHTTGVQLQMMTQGLGKDGRAAGAPEAFNGFARTTQATIANIFANAYQANTTQYEMDNKLYNRYEYTLQAPQIPQWQRDLPGNLVIIEFYSTPNVSCLCIRSYEWILTGCSSSQDTGLVWSNVVYQPLQLVSSKPI